jgi:hypothetical protein
MLKRIYGSNSFNTNTDIFTKSSRQIRKTPNIKSNQNVMVFPYDHLI